MSPFVIKGHLVIKDGPSREDLQGALFDKGCSHCRRRKEVTFHVRFKPAHSINRLRCVIEQVGREDGSGERWLFKGRCVGCEQSDCDTPVEGYLDTKNREGWIKFESDDYPERD